MKKISILIAGHHRLLREAWVVFLQHHPQFTVIASTGQAEEVVELARKLHPDVVIVEIDLPGINSLQATSGIRKYAPATKILALSATSQYTHVKQLLQKGVMGFVTKTSPLAELPMALEEIVHGRKYICTETKSLLTAHQNPVGEQSPKINFLTHRELQIISLIRKGHSSKEIATLLRISAKTVQVHRYNLLKKLKQKNTPALISFLVGKAVG